MVARSSLLLVLVLTACNTSAPPEVKAEPKSTAQANAPAAPTAPPAPNDGTVRLGSPIDTSAKSIALADVAKDPNAYVGKTFTTTGTVTAVCQHMGCWMEIKDDASQAHIKMAGHAFFVPKTASGRKAKVLAKLEKSEDEAACAEGAEKGKTGCRAEAEQQLGRPLAKLELVAEGVELM